MTDEYTDVEVLRERAQLAMRLHKVRSEDVAKALGMADGHVRMVLFYGRKESAGAPCFTELARQLGFDVRTETSELMQEYLDAVAYPGGVPSDG